MIELADALTSVSKAVLKLCELSGMQRGLWEGYEAELFFDVSKRQRTVTQEFTASAKNAT